MNYVMLKINKNKSTVDYWYLFYNHSAVSHCCIQTIVLLHYKQCGLIPPSPHFFLVAIAVFKLSFYPSSIRTGFSTNAALHSLNNHWPLCNTTPQLTTLKEITSSHVRATADIYIMIISVLYIYIIFFFKVHVSALAKQAT